MTKTESGFFFPPPKSEFFFQQHWESEYLKKKKKKKKKTYPPPPPPWKLNGPSLMNVPQPRLKAKTFWISVKSVNNDKTQSFSFSLTLTL